MLLVWGLLFEFQGHKQLFPNLSFLHTCKNSSSILIIFTRWPCFLLHWENRSVQKTHIVTSTRLPTSASTYSVFPPITIDGMSMLPFKTSPPNHHIPPALVQGCCFRNTLFCIIIFSPSVLSWQVLACHTNIIISLILKSKKPLILIPLPPPASTLIFILIC